MSKHPYMTKRGAVWQYRRRYPQDVAKFLGRKEFKKSLETLHKEDAITRSAEASLEFSARVEEAREEIAIIESKNEKLPYEAAVDRIKMWVDKREKELDKLRLSSPGTLTARQAEENLADNENQLHDLKVLSENGIAEISILWSRLFGENLNHLSQEQKDEIFELLRRAKIELIKRILAKDKTDFSKPHFDHLFSDESPTPAKGVDHGGAGTAFGKLAQAYWSNYENEASNKSISKKRRNDVDRLIAVVTELIGAETPAATVNFDAALAFRDQLGSLPTNHKKLYPNLALQKAIERGKKEGRPCLNYVTQQKYLSTLKAILDFGVMRGDLQTNSASKLKPLGKKKPAEDARKPYTVAQLKAIFTAPLYTGCIDDEKNFAKEGDKVIRRARFWVPLICLLHGMRPNEVCQLKPKDMKQTDAGTWYFDLTEVDDDQTLKTVSSRRKFPVHPYLERTGFLDYAAQKKNEKAPRLFPELKPDKYGNYATGFLRWFNRTFYPKVGEREQGQSFYSLRHSFRDELRRIEGPQELLDLLGGWSQGKTVSNTYGAGYSPEQLLKYVEKITYPGLDLSHLYVK